MVFVSVMGMPLHARELPKPRRIGPPKYEDLQKEVKSSAALLVDGATGKILYQRNPDKRYLPASTVKLMTALLVYERMGLNGTIIITPEDTRVEPSNVPLRAGEKVTVSDMMHALLISSDNDCAIALARKTGGTTGKFIELMNLRAQQLGCVNTRFSNPNGLTDGSIQYTTANDLLKIFEKVISFPELRRITQIKHFILQTRVGAKTLKNHNKLLGKYEGMGSAKTGWTYAAKHTYAAAAARDGRELHLILLHSPNKWKDARLLFDYGFANLPSLPSSTPTTVKNQPSSTPPPLVSSAATPKFTSYTITKGDTLSDISTRYHCTVEDILQYNRDLKPKLLQPGQTIQVPAR